VGRHINQGITGVVLWFEGDLMPGMDKKPVQGKPVQRTIDIYQLTNRTNTATDDGIFYHDIKTRLIIRVKTDAAGKFYVSLAKGSYSLFVEEKDGLFSNVLDNQGNIYPVEVNPGSVTPVRIRIDYRAFY
jgi:hypothetical protein